MTAACSIERVTHRVSIWIASLLLLNVTERHASALVDGLDQLFPFGRTPCPPGTWSCYRLADGVGRFLRRVFLRSLNLSTHLTLCCCICALSYDTI
jgi:hypothetical protein